MASERIIVITMKAPTRLANTIGYMLSCYSSRSFDSHSVSHKEGKSWATAHKRQIKKANMIPQQP